MSYKKNRIILIILGFIIFVMPLFLFCNTLETEFIFTKERIEQNLKNKLISSANNFENDLDCYNYLKSEINKIHAELLPNIQEEFLDEIPEDSFTKNLYSKELLDKIINKTINRFNPIMITFGTEDLKELYAYYSPQLEKDLEENKENLGNEKEKLLFAKSFFDMNYIWNKFYYYYNKVLPLEKCYILKKLKLDLSKSKVGFNKFNLPCYKYISRFIDYSKNYEPLYTDYYSKQNLYPIIKYTISKKGIHGFYTLLIPQSIIKPDLLLDYAINNNKSDVEIALDKIIEESGIIHNNNGFEYRLNIPSNLKKHIILLKNLGEIKKTDILNQQIKFSITYPKEYILFDILNKITKVIAILATLMYIVFVIYQIQSHFISFNLTKKLIVIFGIIIFLPTLGIGILSSILLNNINELVDVSVSKNLHNSLENYLLINQEILARRFSSILEMKRKIAKSSLPNLYDQSLIDSFAPKGTKKWEDNLKWFICFNTSLALIGDNRNFYQLNSGNGFAIDDKRTELLLQTHLSKYLNNMGLALNKQEETKEIFASSLLDQYINRTIEEKSVTQESVPLKDFVFFSNFDSSAYYYAKDKNNKKYLFYSKQSETHTRPYMILNNYSLINPLWTQPIYRYAFDTDLAIITYTNFYHKEDNRIQIPSSNNKKELFNRVLHYSDSGYERINNKEESTINEYIFSDNSPFIIAGTAKSQHNNILSLSAKLFFPFLLSYSIIILVLIRKLISSFIDQPIKIYQEALDKLKENHFGIRIYPFSNDEFNSITKAFNEMSIAIKQKEQMKRYVSDKLVQSVESNDIQKAGDSKQEKVTILTSDIRNFTGTSEKYEPSEIVEMLNSYFTKMQKAISDNGGIIDKYIGDAIQAVFYDEPDKENQVIRASKAALAMRKALKKFNEERKSKGLFTIENGIGIDTDFAITGTIGTQNGRKDFSVNGDVIARAAALEAKTKNTNSKILISKKSLEFEDPFSQPFGCQLPQQQSFEGASLAVTQMKSCPQEVGGSGFGVAKDERGLLISNNGSTTKTADYNYHSSLSTNHLPLVFKIFDEDSVELIDVRE